MSSPLAGPTGAARRCPSCRWRGGSAGPSLDAPRGVICRVDGLVAPRAWVALTRRVARVRVDAELQAQRVHLRRARGAMGPHAAGWLQATRARRLASSATAFMPRGNLTAFVTMCPFSSRLFIQQSSMLTYTYPASRSPLAAIALATSSTTRSLMSQRNVFHEFHPMAGVRPTPLSRALVVLIRTSHEATARGIVPYTVPRPPAQRGARHFFIVQV
eukprot:scaffold9150_cov120-Isochrysis_galbana.AAC.7